MRSKKLFVDINKTALITVQMSKGLLSISATLYYSYDISIKQKVFRQ